MSNVAPTTGFVVAGMPPELAERINKHRAMFRGWTMMADDNGDQNDTGPGEDTKESRLPKDQAELDAIIRDRVRRAKPSDYDEAKRKAKRLDEIEEQQKTDAQKQADALTAEQTARANAERDAARYKAAVEHPQITGQWLEFVGGATPDEIADSANRLAGLIDGLSSADKNRQQSVPVGDMKPMATPPGAPHRPNGSSGIAEAERRFGKL